MFVKELLPASLANIKLLFREAYVTQKGMQLIIPYYSKILLRIIRKRLLLFQKISKNQVILY